MYLCNGIVDLKEQFAGVVVNLRASDVVHFQTTPVYNSSS